MTTKTTPTPEWPTDNDLDFQERAAVFGPPLEEIQRLIAGCRDRNRLERKLKKLRALLKLPEDFQAAIDEGFCARCESPCSTPNGLEPTPECDVCCQDLLESARAALGGDRDE